MGDTDTRWHDCQLSRIIRESPHFEPYLPVSRFMSVISRFWGVSSGLQICVCNLPDKWWSLPFVVCSTLLQGNLKCLAVLFFVVNVCCLLPPPPPPSLNLWIWPWCNASVRRFAGKVMFSIFEDVWGWQPCYDHTEIYILNLCVHST